MYLPTTPTEWQLWAHFSAMSEDGHHTLASFKCFFTCLMALLTSWLEGSEWELLAPRENPPYLKEQPDIKIQCDTQYHSAADITWMCASFVEVKSLIQSRTKDGLGETCILASSDDFWQSLNSYGYCPRGKDLHCDYTQSEMSGHWRKNGPSSQRCSSFHLVAPACACTWVSGCQGRQMGS